MLNFIVKYCTLLIIFSPIIFRHMGLIHKWKKKKRREKKLCCP